MFVLSKHNNYANVSKYKVHTSWKNADSKNTATCA